jgi:hypothetical protein
MGTNKAVLVLLFAMLLALSIVYVVPTLAQGPSTPKMVTKPPTSTIAAAGNMIQVSNFISTYANYLSNTPPKKLRYVTFTAISNEPDGVATYSKADMKYDKNSGTLTGDGDQYFSNREWSPPTAANIMQTIYYPFDPKKTDKLRLTLDTNSDSATLVLISHGTQETIGLQVSNNVLYGFTSTSPAAMFVISLQETELNAP